VSLSQPRSFPFCPFLLPFLLGGRGEPAAVWWSAASCQLKLQQQPRNSLDDFSPQEEQDKRILTFPHLFHITPGSEDKMRGSAAQTLKKQTPPRKTPRKPSLKCMLPVQSKQLQKGHCDFILLKHKSTWVTAEICTFR